MSFDDLTSLLPVIIFVVVMVFVVVIVIVSVIFSVVLSLSPFALLGWLFSKKSKEAKAAAEASKNWIPATGRILKSRTEVSGGRFTTVRPYVLYEYEVNGQLYKNDLIRASDRILVIQRRGSREAYETIDRYPEGAAVQVFYNPANPCESVLEK